MENKNIALEQIVDNTKVYSSSMINTISVYIKNIKILTPILYDFPPSAWIATFQLVLLSPSGGTELGTQVSTAWLTT